MSGAGLGYKTRNATQEQPAGEAPCTQVRVGAAGAGLAPSSLPTSRFEMACDVGEVRPPLGPQAAGRVVRGGVLA